MMSSVTTAPVEQNLKTSVMDYKAETSSLTNPYAEQEALILNQKQNAQQGHHDAQRIIDLVDAFESTSISSSYQHQLCNDNTNRGNFQGRSLAAAIGTLSRRLYGEDATAVQLNEPKLRRANVKNNAEFTNNQSNLELAVLHWANAENTNSIACDYDEVRKSNCCQSFLRNVRIRLTRSIRRY